MRYYNSILIQRIFYAYFSIQYNVKIIVAVSNFSNCGFIFKCDYCPKLFKGINCFWVRTGNLGSVMV
jgi:hypothetical protein